MRGSGGMRKVYSPCVAKDQKDDEQLKGQSNRLRGVAQVVERWICIIQRSVVQVRPPPLNLLLRGEKRRRC